MGLSGGPGELLDVPYEGASVLLQHGGEPRLGRDKGERTGGVISSMSSVTGMTAGLVQELDLQPGHGCRTSAPGPVSPRR